MKKYLVAALQLLGQVGRDRMLAAALAAPVLVGLLVRFGVPALDRALSQYLGADGFLLPYYALFDLFLAMMAPVLFCFSFAMLLLEEVDDRVTRYLMVTPLGRRGYLLSRIGVPTAASLLFTPVLLWLFQISGLTPGAVLAATLLGAALGSIVALMIVSLSANKLEGIAVTKLSTAMTLGVLPPFFLQGAAAWPFAILPSFWLAKAVLEAWPPMILGGMVVSAVWILLLARRFGRRVCM